METVEQLDNQTEMALKERNYQTAQEYAWQQLDRDKLRESAVRQLMTALARLGQRSAAMAQYEIYSKRLEESLGAKPSAELAELYGSIQNEELQQTVLRSRIQVPSDTAEINPIFCYTDIESSTRLWDEHREAMFGALLQHNDICETEIERFEGRILHPTGDGFLIVLEQNDPLAFAISLQQKFAEADWGEIGELRIRIGLHGTTAEQEGHEFFREGAWYRGSILNHAARISDTGHGGQIVASSFVKEQCPLPDGASWIDLGVHGLKSLDDKQQIFGLMHPDLPIKEFPPLRTPENKKAAQTAKIRGYQLGQKIGQGAFGDVYRAVQPGVGRPVAVKIIRSLYANQPEFIRRFEAEAQIIARLEHPNIVPLYDYWRESDGAFLVMRFMRGGSLEGLLQEGPLDLTTAISYLDQVAAALTFAHSQGYVHRDIKPANILLDEQGNAYLSDFGIVKDLSSSYEGTQTGAVVGSPAYLSPEQALSHPVTPMSDQYSLAVTLYEMLTGERAFDDASPASLIVKHLNEPLPLVRGTRPELALAVDECIQKAAAKEPSARYPDILAMMRALHAATGTGSSALAMPTALLDPERELVNPYQGLRSFQEADAVKFFGRKALVEQLLTRFTGDNGPAMRGLAAEERFLAVVGPSGSGKSSVVKAGLLPALKNGAVSGSDKWFVVEMVPSTHPLEELEAALLRVAVNPPDSIIQQLREDERGLTRALKRILPADESELLLMIDQFEELFTLVEDDQRRNHFINSLMTALDEQNGRLRVVATLRADFYDRPLLTPGLAELMRQRTEVVPPLTRAELEEVIVQPALQVGAMFEAGLVPTIIDDVSAQPGALPLLQYALTELFERRKERLLTLAAYAEIGGVMGALGRRAEELYTELDVEGEEAARQLFMRLVTLGEGTEDTRRRVLRSEVMALGVDAVPVLSSVEAMDRVIDAYGRYRLLTFDHDPLTREPTVEVAHEALLRDWERLRTWLDDSRDDVRLQRSLAAFAAEWSANEQDEGFLLHESRLDLLAGWAAGTTLALTPEEQTFLSASTAAREQRRFAEQERQQRELETAQRLAREQTQRAEEQVAAAQNLRRRAAYLGVALVVAALLAIAAVFAGIQANNNAQTAVANANIAATQEAAAEAAQAEALAKAEEAQNNANLAAAAEAIAEEERSLAQASEAAALAAQEEALAAQAEAIGQAEIARFNEEQAQSLVLTAGAKDAHSGGRVDLALALAVEAVGIEQPPTEAVRTLNDVAFSYGTRLVYEHEDQDRHMDFVDMLPGDSPLISRDSGHTLTVWDPNSGKILNQFDTANEDAAFRGVVNIPNSTNILTAYDNDDLIVWDWSTGEKVQSWSGIDMVHMAGMLGGPNGNTVIYSSGIGGSETAVDGIPAGFNLTAWDIESGEEIYHIDGERGESMEWIEESPDNKIALIGTSLVDEELNVGLTASLYIIDLETGDVVSEPALDELTTSNIFSMAINPAGDQAFIVLRENENSEFGNTGLIISLPAGEVTAVVPFDREIIYANYSPDGTQIAVERDSPSQIYFTLLDATTGEQLRDFGSINEGHDGIVNKGGFTFTPDGKRLVSGGGGVVQVWDVETGEIIQRLFAHGGESIFSTTVSPDGLSAISAGGGLLHFWDINEDTTARVFEEHKTDSIYGLAISPDGTKAISTGIFADDEAGNEAILWDTSTFEVIHRLPGFFPSAAFLPDGRSAILGEDLEGNSVPGDSNMEMAFVHWDLESGDLLNRSVIPDAAAPVDLAMSPDGKSFLAGTISNLMVHHDIETFSELNRLTSNAEGEWFISVAFSPNGQSALAGGDLGDIILFDLESGEEIRRYTPGSVTEGLAVRADGEQFVSAGSDNTLVMWDFASGEVIQTFSGHTDGVTSVAFTPDESQIVSSSADGSLILWDVASGEPLRTFSEHGVFINELVLSSDGKVAYSAADDGTVIARPIAPLPVDEILAHIADNRVLYEFTCVERKQYRILPLCDADGLVPDSDN